MFRKFFGIITAVIIGGVLGLFLWSAYSVVVLNRADIYAENGLLENIQAILVLIACIVFLAIVIEKRSDKLILLSCSLLCLTFMLREVDVEYLDVPNALKLIGAGVGRNTMLAAAFIALFSYAAFRFSYYKNAAGRFLSSKPGVLLITGGVLLIIGEFFEKQGALNYHVYIEEMCELVAYVFILLAAFAV